MREIETTAQLEGWDAIAVQHVLYCAKRFGLKSREFRRIIAPLLADRADGLTPEAFVRLCLDEWSLN